MTLPDGFLPVPHAFRDPFSLPDWVLAIGHEQWQGMPIANVPLGRILATKTAVLLPSVATAVAAISEGSWDRSRPSGSPCLPLGYLDDEGFVSLTDGHHRLVATRLCGLTEMPVRVAGPKPPPAIILDPRTPFVAGMLAALTALSD